MPVLLRVKGYKIWFYEADLEEPPHVHIGKAGLEAKYWLEPLRLARSGRFKPFELREIERILDDNHHFMLSARAREKCKRADG